MKIVFFGTPQFAVPSLEYLLSHPNFEVLAVVTQPDKRRGRGTQLTPSPIKTVALKHKLPIWQPKSIKRNREILDELQATQADAFVVVAYGQILSQEILDMPRLGCINAHGSLLPRYRGAAPIQWCLYHGEPRTGITTMLMDAGMDTGAMLLKADTAIGLLDNSLDLAETLAIAAADLLVETLVQLENQKIEPVPQPNDQATNAPLIQKQDYQLDWSRSAIALHNQTRGFFPNCVTTFRGKQLKVTATAPLQPEYRSSLMEVLGDIEQNWPWLFTRLDYTSVQPGEIVDILKGQGPVIQTGKGLLLLREVQLAGKRSQPGWDFANGNRLEVGERLGDGSG